MTKVKDCFVVARDGDQILVDDQLSDLKGYAILPAENLFQIVHERDDFPELDKQHLAMIIRRLFESGRLKAKY